jgi:hypothetical protein
MADPEPADYPDDPLRARVRFEMPFPEEPQARYVMPGVYVVPAEPVEDLGHFSLELFTLVDEREREPEPPAAPTFWVQCSNAACAAAHDSGSSFPIDTDRTFKSVDGLHEVSARQTIYYCTEECRATAVEANALAARAGL